MRCETAQQAVEALEAQLAEDPLLVVKVEDLTTESILDSTAGALRGVSPFLVMRNVSGSLRSIEMSFGRHTPSVFSGIRTPLEAVLNACLEVGLVIEVCPKQQAA